MQALSTPIPIRKVFLLSLGSSVLAFFGLVLIFASTKSSALGLFGVSVLLFVGCPAFAVVYAYSNIVAKFFAVGEKILTEVFDTVRHIIATQIAGLKEMPLDAMAPNVLPNISETVNQVLQETVIPILQQATKKRAPIIGGYLAQIFSKTLIFATKSLLSSVESSDAGINRTENIYSGQNQEMSFESLLPDVNPHISSMVEQYGRKIDDALCKAQKLIGVSLTLGSNYVLNPARIIRILIIALTFLPSLIIYVMSPTGNDKVVKPLNHQNSEISYIASAKTLSASVESTPTPTPVGIPEAQALSTRTVSATIAEKPVPVETQAIPRAIPVNLTGGPTPEETKPIPRAIPVSIPGESTPEETKLIPRAMSATTTGELAAEVLTFCVVGIPTDDFLNMRQGPSSMHPVVLRLRLGVAGIVLVGQPVINGTTKWQCISVQGQSGWVNADYLGVANTSDSATSVPPSHSGTPVPIYSNMNPNLR